MERAQAHYVYHKPLWWTCDCRSVCVTIENPLSLLNSMNLYIYNQDKSEFWSWRRNTRKKKQDVFFRWEESLWTEACLTKGQLRSSGHLILEVELGTLGRNDISLLDWECLVIPQKQMKRMAGNKVWTDLPSLWTARKITACPNDNDCPMTDVWTHEWINMLTMKHWNMHHAHCARILK